MGHSIQSTNQPLIDRRGSRRVHVYYCWCTGGNWNRVLALLRVLARKIEERRARGPIDDDDRANGLAGTLRQSINPSIDQSVTK